MARIKPEKHAGYAHVKNSFDQVLEHLKENSKVQTKTESGTPFIARADVTTKSQLHPNEQCIIFLQHSKKDGKLKEYARCYKCCWGHYCNCSATIIGTYCEALDASV